MFLPCRRVFLFLTPDKLPRVNTDSSPHNSRKEFRIVAPCNDRDIYIWNRQWISCLVCEDAVYCQQDPMEGSIFPSCDNLRDNSAHNEVPCTQERIDTDCQYIGRLVLTRVMGNTSPMFLSYEKVEAELHDTVKTKRGTQIKWRSLVTKLQLRKLAKQSNS